MFRSVVLSGKTLKLAIVVCSLLIAAAAFAGPVIDFGDEGYLKIDLKGQVYIETLDFGSGMDFQDSRTDLHFQRLRLTATGMINDTWGYKFQTCGHIGSTRIPIGFIPEMESSNDNDRDIRIIDTYAIANFSPAVNFKVGLTKLPISRANLVDCFAPLTFDRSNFTYNAYGVSAAKFSRDIGVMMHGNFNDDHFKYFLGAFQGREGITMLTNPLNAMTYRTTFEPASNLEFTARVHYSFLEPELGAGYVGTYFGDMPVLTIGLGLAHESSAVYRNVNFDPATGAVTVLDDDAADLNEYAADLFFEYPFESAGTVTVNGQYMKVDFDDAYKTNHNPGDLLGVIAGLNGQKEGGYGKVAWILPGTVGEEGLIQPYFGYENWDFAVLAGVMDQTITQYSYGINYYVDRQNVRITAEYQKTDFDKPTALPVGMGNMVTGMSDFGTFRTMLQVVF